MAKNKKKIENGPKIVAIGGGTGLSTILRGLKKHTSNLTAIVTVADDGGSSGLLREDLGILPPGDIRDCLLALANTEPSMEKLFNYRFKEGLLKDQNMGNLLIAAMNDIYGNFDIAIREMSNVLAVTGKVLPMSLQNVQLSAILKNGKIIQGESKIAKGALENNSSIDKVFIEPEKVYPVSQSVKSIREADLIILGPGSLYTSIIPNLLVKGIVKELKEANAPIVYICNVMTELGETNNFTLYDHVEAILKHSDKDLIDYVIGNTQPIPKIILDKYKREGSLPVFYSEKDLKKLEKSKIKLIASNLVELEDGYIRHNNEKICKLIIDLYEKK